VGPCWRSEILWSSGYVGTCWEGWDLLTFWVCGTILEGCDIVIFWVFGTILGSVRKNYVSTELLFFIDPLQISQIINEWTKSTECRLELRSNLHSDIPSYSSRTAPIHQYTPKQNNTPTYSRRLLRMNVITFGTCWTIKTFI